MSRASGHDCVWQIVSVSCLHEIFVSHIAILSRISDTFVGSSVASGRGIPYAVRPRIWFGCSICFTFRLLIPVFGSSPLLCRLKSKPYSHLTIVKRGLVSLFRTRRCQCNASSLFDILSVFDGGLCTPPSSTYGLVVCFGCHFDSPLFLLFLPL